MLILMQSRLIAFNEKVEITYLLLFSHNEKKYCFGNFDSCSHQCEKVYY